MVPQQPAVRNLESREPSRHLADKGYATLAIQLPPDEWPMGARVRQRVEVSRAGVRLQAEIEAGADAMPAALGWHPWFLRRGDPHLRIDAATYQLTDGLVPTGVVAPVAGRTDLRGGPRLGKRRLDLAYLGARSPAAARASRTAVLTSIEP